MQIVAPNEAPLMVCQKYIRALKLTTSERKLVDSASKEIAKLHRLTLPYMRTGRDSLNQAIHAASINPCAETVEAIDRAETRRNASTDSIRFIKQALGVPINKHIDSLRPVALRCLDSIIDGLKADHEAHCEAVSKSPFSDKTDSGPAERSLQRTLDLFAGDRKRIETEHAALHYLCQWGLTVDPFEKLLIEGDPEDGSDPLAQDFH